MIDTLRRTATALLAAGVLVTAISVGVVRAQEAGGDSIAITEGYVDWGFKESWRNYVREGTTLSEGATWSPEGVYRFPIREGTYDVSTKTTVLELDGRAYFSAHGDVLHMEVWDLRVVISPDEQTVWGNISSRDLNDVQIHHYGMTPIALLDIPAVDPTNADGTTTWEEIPSSLTAEAAPRFIGYYPVGQTLDPVTVVYEGPGGKPDPEVLTPPGTPAVEVFEPVSQGFNLSIASANNQVSGLFYDETNGLLHIVSARQNFLRAADAETLEPVGQPSTRQGVIPTQPAFDPATGQIFAVSAAAGESAGTAAITASTWNADTQSYDTEVVDSRGSVSLISPFAWDPIGERLVVYAREGSASFIRTWERHADSWTRVDYALVPPEGQIWAWYGPGTGVGLGAASDGAFILARGAGGSVVGAGVSQPALRLTLDDGIAHVEEIPGTEVTDPTVPATQSVIGWGERVTVGEDGTVVLIRPQGTYDLMVLEPSGSTFVPLAEAQTESIGVLRTSVVDPSDGTVLVTDTQAGNLIVARQGRVVARQQIPGMIGSAFPANIPGGTALVDEGTIVAVTVHEGVAHLTRVRVSGASPVFETQPEDATLVLSGASSVPVEFHARALGDPAPDLQWQTRAPGGGVWRDIEGETSETLALEATESDHGSQYRLRATNDAGRNVSDTATLTLAVPPSIEVQPEPANVDAGDNAEFLVMPAGNPIPDVTWQRLVGGVWTDLANDDPSYLIDGGFLTVLAVGVADSGTQFRALLSSSAGTALSDVVALTVSGDPQNPGDGEQVVVVDVPDLGSGEFSWTIDGDPNVSLGIATFAEGSFWQATGELRPIIVVDTRPDGPGWSVSGQVGDFTGGLAGSHLGWTPRVTAQGAGATAGVPVAAGFPSGDGLSVSSTLASAAPGHALGAATLGAALDLRVPGSTPAGSYTGTLTITALG